MDVSSIGCVDGCGAVEADEHEGRTTTKNIDSHTLTTPVYLCIERNSTHDYIFDMQNEITSWKQSMLKM